MIDDFKVKQHDRDLLAAAVTSLTGEPVEVGDTFVAFLATLTPATSGGVRFHLYADGAVEAMYADCGDCGRTVSGHEPGQRTAEQYTTLHSLATRPRAGLVTRVRRRLLGCPACTPPALSQPAAAS